MICLNRALIYGKACADYLYFLFSIFRIKIFIISSRNELIYDNSPYKFDNLGVVTILSKIFKKPKELFYL